VNQSGDQRCLLALDLDTQTQKHRNEKAMFPITYYQVLTVSAERAYPVGFQPKYGLCGHHHTTLSDACSCRRSSFPERQETHRLILAHAVYGFGSGSRELFWLDEDAQEFVQVVNSRGKPTPSFICVPTPQDFQAAADRAFDTVEPEPTIARMLRRVA